MTLQLQGRTPASVATPPAGTIDAFADSTDSYKPKYKDSAGNVHAMASPGNAILVTDNAYSNLKCDGSTDDLAALNALYAAAPDHSVLLWPSAATMVLSGTASIPAGKHFVNQGAGNQKTFIQITSGTADIISVGDWQSTFDGLSFTSQTFQVTGNQAITGAAQTLNITGGLALTAATGVVTIPSTNATGTFATWVVFTYTARTSTTITGTATGTGAGFTGIPFGGAPVTGSGYFRSGGYAINGGTNVDIFITGCDFTGMYNGVLLNGTLCSIRDTQFSNTINFDMQFNGTNVNSIIDNVTADGSPPAVAHVEVNQCGSLLISNCDLIRGNVDLRINPTSPNGCFGIYAMNTYFDTAVPMTLNGNCDGVKLMGTGNIQRVKFVNCWMSSAGGIGGNGLEFASTAATLPTAIDLVNCDIYSNGANGILATAVQDWSVSHSRIAGNVTAGINAVAAAVHAFTINANRIGPTGGIGANGTGILVNAGTYLAYSITDNDVRGNTTANITDSGSTATTDARYVRDNLGHLLQGAIATLAAPQATVSTTNTAILVARIPANAVKVGDIIRISCHGISSSTGVLSFFVRVGATGTAAGGVPADAAAWGAVASAAQVANQRAGFDALLTVRSIGAGGTVQCEGLGYAQAALLPTVVAAVATSPAVTTAAWFITIACTCSVGTWTAQQAVVAVV